MEFLHSDKLAKDKKNSSTQQFVDVEEIKDGSIVLKNKSLRAVLMVSSVNFNLKSSEEQDAIIYKYQDFINSLDFPLQIIVSSRKLNIEPYLEMLRDKEIDQTNELLKMQISEYREFIKSLTDVSNIMSKFFYIVVPFYPIERKDKGFFGKITDIFNPSQTIMERRELFETYKNQLWQRVDHIIAGLSGTGLQITPLKTEEIIELLYNYYNPSVFTSSIIKDVDEIKLD